MTTTVVVASSTSRVVVVSRYLSVLMVVSSYVAERGGPGGFLKLADSLEPRHKLNALMCVTRQISLIISLANILRIYFVKPGHFAYCLSLSMYLSCLELDVEMKGILGFHVSLKRWVTGIALSPKS